jgi:hypothetical protein
MFKVVTKNEVRTFKKKVEFQMPNMAGKYEKTSFMGIFNMLSSDEIESLEPGIRASTLARRVLLGAEDLIDNDDKPLTFNDDVKEEMLANPIVAQAICATFWLTVNGGQLARKN